MKKAELKDLVLEKWLRARNEGTLVWVTKDGKEMPIKDMTDSHLENAIKHCINKCEFDEIAAEYSAFVDSHWG